MDNKDSPLLYQRISRWRWYAPIAALALVLAHQLIEHTWLTQLPRWQHFTTQLLFYGLVGPTMAWFALTSLRYSVLEAYNAEQALLKAHQQLANTNEHLASLLRVNHRLSKAHDKETLYKIILEIFLEISPATGCSFFRFDERHRPLPALHYGILNDNAFEAWSSHLTETHYCERCICHTATIDKTVNICAAYQSDLAIPGIGQVYCVLLTRNDRIYGVINLYLPVGRDWITSQEQSLIMAIAQEISLALESHALRAHEMDMLRRLQQAGQSRDLSDKLAYVIQPTVAALQVEGGALCVIHPISRKLETITDVGHWNSNLLKDIEQLAQWDTASCSIVHQLDNHTQESLLITPLHTDNELFGFLILSAKKPQVFTSRRIQLIEIVAGQLALLIDNYRLYTRAEHQAMLNERTRLAREIHDGLAQSLAYLKLRVSQIIRWYNLGENSRTLEGLDEVRLLIHDAYVDAREAIDGLHIQADADNMQAWLSEIISEFEELSGLVVSWQPPPGISLSLEQQMQLQRIIQETLSNIRKHANASTVQMNWHSNDGNLILEIYDDGEGFDPQDIPQFARHGLRVMSERAELVDADLHVTSTPGRGTRIRLKLPYTLNEASHG